MTIKVTSLFQQATAPSDPTRPVHRLGGWSESWYYPGTSLNSAIAQYQGQGGVFGSVGWGPARAGLLGLGAAIVGQRFQVVNPVGPAQSTAFQFVGAPAREQDIPQAALLLKVPGLNVLNIRKTVLRGIPDSQIFEGELSTDFVYLTQLQLFQRELANWQFRGRDLSQPTIRIISISAMGVVTTEAPPPYVVGDIVRVLKTKLPTGKLVGGRFQVVAVGPGFNQVTLLNWGFGPTTIGSVRKDLIVFIGADSANVTVSRIVTRRVGRPFFQFRGRRSKSKG